ncbi:MAG: hypothetical protein EOM20_12175 [Spartobacteria bacterium]|nr:hypothetical protein [Spartobacteria bacterium]
MRMLESISSKSIGFSGGGAGFGLGADGFGACCAGLAAGFFEGVAAGFTGLTSGFATGFSLPFLPLSLPPLNRLSNMLIYQGLLAMKSGTCHYTL